MIRMCLSQHYLAVSTEFRGWDSHSICWLRRGHMPTVTWSAISQPMRPSRCTHLKPRVPEEEVQPLGSNQHHKCSSGEDEALDNEIPLYAALSNVTSLFPTESKKPERRQEVLRVSTQGRLPRKHLSGELRSSGSAPQKSVSTARAATREVSTAKVRFINSHEPTFFAYLISLSNFFPPSGCVTNDSPGSSGNQSNNAGRFQESYYTQRLDQFTPKLLVSIYFPSRTPGTSEWGIIDVHLSMETELAIVIGTTTLPTADISNPSDLLMHSERRTMAKLKESRRNL